MSTMRELKRMRGQGRGPLMSLDADEPIFILRARDPLAVATIQFWSEDLEDHGGDPKKVEGAREVMQEMLLWQAANGTKVPD